MLGSTLSAVRTRKATSDAKTCLRSVSGGVAMDSLMWLVFILVCALFVATIMAGVAAVIFGSQKHSTWEGSTVDDAWD